MRQRIPVSTIMTKNLVALTRSDNLERAELLFNRYKIKHMPVVSGEAIIGMLSYTDLMRISFAEASSIGSDTLETVVFNNFSIEEVMVKDVVTISTDTTIKEAAQILAEKEFHALPVLKDGALVGIVTTTDLLNYFIKQF